MTISRKGLTVPAACGDNTHMNNTTRSTAQDTLNHAQRLADESGLAMVIVRGSRRRYIYRVVDFDFAFAATNVVVVPPTGMYPVASPQQIIDAELAKWAVA